jgi:hypothetical protein
MGGAWSSLYSWLAGQPDVVQVGLTTLFCLAIAPAVLFVIATGFGAFDRIVAKLAHGAHLIEAGPGVPVSRLHGRLSGSGLILIVLLGPVVLGYLAFNTNAPLAVSQAVADPGASVIEPVQPRKTSAQRAAGEPCTAKPAAAHST